MTSMRVDESLKSFLTSYEEEHDNQPFSYRGSLHVNASMTIPVDAQRNLSQEFLRETAGARYDSESTVYELPTIMYGEVTSVPYPFVDSSRRATFDSDNGEPSIAIFGIQWNRVERAEAAGVLDLVDEFQIEFELLFVSLSRTNFSNMNSTEEVKHFLRRPAFKRQLSILPEDDEVEVDAFSVRIDPIDDSLHQDEKEDDVGEGNVSSESGPGSGDETDESEDEQEVDNDLGYESDDQSMVVSENQVFENNSRRQKQSLYDTFSLRGLKPLTTENGISIFSLSENDVTSNVVKELKQHAKDGNMIASNPDLVNNLSSEFVGSYDNVVVGVRTPTANSSNHSFCFITLIKNGSKDIPQCGDTSKFVDMILDPAMVVAWEKDLMNQVRSSNTSGSIAKVVGVYVPTQLVQSLYRRQWSIQDDCGDNGALPSSLESEIMHSNNVLANYKRLENELLQTQSVRQRLCSDGVQRYLMTKKS